MQFVNCLFFDVMSMDVPNFISIGTSWNADSTLDTVNMSFAANSFFL